MTPAAASSAADAIDAALLEGQGLLRLAIVEAKNVHHLDASSDEHACIVRILQIVADTLNDHTSPSPAPLLCLLYANQFWRDRPPRAVAVLNAPKHLPDCPGKYHCRTGRPPAPAE